MIREAEDVVVLSVEQVRGQAEHKGEADEKSLCISLSWKLKIGHSIPTHTCIHTDKDTHNITHLSVATCSPKTFPFTDCQASVSTSGCFLRPVFLRKDAEGLRRREKPTSAILESVFCRMLQVLLF